MTIHNCHLVICVTLKLAGTSFISHYLSAPLLKTPQLCLGSSGRGDKFLGQGQGRLMEASFGNLKAIGTGEEMYSFFQEGLRRDFLILENVSSRG